MDLTEAQKKYMDYFFEKELTFKKIAEVLRVDEKEVRQYLVKSSGIYDKWRKYQREWSKKRYHSNPEYRKKRINFSLEWNKKHREKVRRYNEKYRKNHPDRIKESNIKWMKKKEDCKIKQKE